MRKEESCLTEGGRRRKTPCRCRQKAIHSKRRPQKRKLMGGKGGIPSLKECLDVNQGQLRDERPALVRKSALEEEGEQVIHEKKKGHGVLPRPYARGKVFALANMFSKKERKKTARQKKSPEY